MKKLFLCGAALLFFLFLPTGTQAFAEELKPVILSDAENHAIRITAEGGEKIKALYIRWDDPVVPYQIRTDGKTIDCGEHGFLHEFIALPEPDETVTILLPEQQMRICQDGIRIFSDEEVPEDVQIWQPPCEQADIMLIPSHSDDEILYMGGIAPIYGEQEGASVQVVYMTEFWTTWPVREHEKLDGLWTDGVRHYPVCANFRDVYAADLEAALARYDYQEVNDYLTDIIRRFQPQIVVTHDFDGEYGHGFHRLVAKATAEALENAKDETYRTETEVFQTYGVWDTPKAYFHLYQENKIRLDMRKELSAMGGQTALEAATAAYDKHVSQHIYAFRVSDDYRYSCADFGLYRTTVGYDTENSMLEHIVLYDEQKRLEEERLEAERLEQERIEQERLEQERLEQERLREEEQRLKEQERLKQEEEKRLEEKEQKERIQMLQMTAVGVGSLVIIAGTLVAIRHIKKKKC